MNLFILHPGIYSRFAENGILFLDTERNRNIVFSKEDSKHIQGLECGYIIENDVNGQFLDILDRNEFGYFVQCDKYPIYFNSINFTSSKSKLSQASVILDGNNSLNFIEKISFFIDCGPYELFNQNLAFILDFPRISSSDLTKFMSVLSSVTFPNLKEVEVVSALSNRAIEFASHLSDCGYFVTFRTIILHNQDLDVLTNKICLCPKIQFKVYLNAALIQSTTCPKASNIYYVYWSTSVKEILENPEYPIIPIIYDATYQKDLISAVLLTPEDILNLKLNKFQIRYNSIFNASFMGKITFVGDKVVCGNQPICYISEFPDKYSLWLYNPENIWFSSRNKKPICKDCMYCDLCPSVSLIEQIGIIPHPCHKY